MRQQKKNKNKNKIRKTLIIASFFSFQADTNFNLKMAQILCRKGHPGAIDGKDASVSPLYGSFQNVCPLYLTASDTEVFVNEVIATEKVAREAKVVTSLIVEPHGPHATPVFNLDEAIFHSQINDITLVDIDQAFYA